MDDISTSSISQAHQEIIKSELSLSEKTEETLPILDLDRSHSKRNRKEQKAFLDQVNAFLEIHLDDPELCLDLLAQEMNMTIRTLSRKFYSVTGASPARQIKNYRLQKASILLKEGHPIATTAYRVGFTSTSYFATAFKKVYHQTPSDFVFFAAEQEK